MIARFSAVNGLTLGAWASALTLMALAEVAGRTAVLVPRALAEVAGRTAVLVPRALATRRLDNRRPSTDPVTGSDRDH